MTPKEKAIDLVDTYKFVLWSEDTQCGDEILCTGIAKRCALILVDEIIENQENVIAKIEYKLLLKDIKIITFSNYWNEVKTEIKKL